MLGTLNGALEVRGVSLSGDDISAEVEGVNVLENRLPVLRRIEVRYRLRIPAGSRELVDRALERHQEKCPTAATLAGAVEISWTADIQEAEA
jgi:uncharacterized OsmC-like protein